jgi:hypothetical protein
MPFFSSFSFTGWADSNHKKSSATNAAVAKVAVPVLITVVAQKRPHVRLRKRRRSANSGVSVHSLNGNS